MNFNKWFGKFSIKTDGGYSNSDYEFVAEESWLECKKQILKILKKDKLAYHEALNSGALNKIKNL